MYFALLGVAPMRNVTNVLMFAVALLIIVGMFALRDQSFLGFKRSLGGIMDKGRPAAVKPQIPLKNERSRSVASRHLEEAGSASRVAVKVTVIPVEPKPAMETIQVGMAKASVWGDFGRPDAMTTLRDGDRFLETFIYLLEPSKATIVRLVNGTVVSVKNTRTVSPPLLVPQSSGISTPVSLASDVL